MEVRKKCIEEINFELLESVELRTPIILGCDVASLGKESPNF